MPTPTGRLAEEGDARMMALEGLKVVDLSTTLSGAHASQLFGDFGSEVYNCRGSRRRG
jgi:crotonobetainyl-CoA:carnitine CoA-transferase CaiB-like acyl-CoA transferase